MTAQMFRALSAKLDAELGLPPSDPLAGFVELDGSCDVDIARRILAKLAIDREIAKRSIAGKDESQFIPKATVPVDVRLQTASRAGRERKKNVLPSRPTPPLVESSPVALEPDQDTLNKARAVLAAELLNNRSSPILVQTQNSSAPPVFLETEFWVNLRKERRKQGMTRLLLCLKKKINLIKSFYGKLALKALSMLVSRSADLVCRYRHHCGRKLLRLVLRDWRQVNDEEQAYRKALRVRKEELLIKRMVKKRLAKYWTQLTAVFKAERAVKLVDASQSPTTARQRRHAAFGTEPAPVANDEPVEVADATSSVGHDLLDIASSMNRQGRPVESSLTCSLANKRKHSVPSKSTASLEMRAAERRSVWDQRRLMQVERELMSKAELLAIEFREDRKKLALRKAKRQAEREEQARVSLAAIHRMRHLINRGIRGFELALAARLNAQQQAWRQYWARRGRHIMRNWHSQAQTTLQFLTLLNEKAVKRRFLRAMDQITFDLGMQKIESARAFHRKQVKTQTCRLWLLVALDARKGDECKIDQVARNRLCCIFGRFRQGCEHAKINRLTEEKENLLWKKVEKLLHEGE